MSQNPGPASPGADDADQQDHQQHPPVDTGTGPNEADVNQESAGRESVGTAAEDPEEEGRFDAG